MKRALLLAVLCTTFALAGLRRTAHAQTVRELALDWPEVPGCPTHASIERQVEAQLGRALGEARDALEVRAQLVRTEPGYVLALETVHRGQRGARRFEAPRCAEVSAAAVLLIALSLEDAQASVEEAREPRELPPDDAPTPPPPARAPPQLSAHAGGLVERGVLSRAGAGVVLGARLSLGRSHVGLAGMWLPPVRSARADDGARVAVTLGAVRTDYCHDLFGRRARLRGCAGLELGGVAGAGLDLARNTRKRFVWSAGWVALPLAVGLTRSLGVTLEPSLAVPFARPQFVSSDANGRRSAVLHALRPTSVRFTLGVELFF